MNILHIESSIFAGDGVSTQLSRELVKSLSDDKDSVKVIEKKFSSDPIPHFDAEVITALMAKPSDRDEKQVHLVAYADQQIKEIEHADILVIGLPMYNFGVPSMLKSWFDYIARAGVTFRYTENGPEGLLKNKKAYVVATRGGKYKDTPADTQSPFVLTFLNFIGIDDVEFIYAEGLNMGDESRAHAIEQATNQIKLLALA